MIEQIFSYKLSQIEAPRLGLIALQSDETIEGDLRRLLPRGAEFMVSRVVSDAEVTRETLGEMEGHLTAAAALFPAGVEFDVIGYGCTSGTAQIGVGRIAEKIRSGTAAVQVTQPLSALVAACRALNVKRLAFLSPYVGEVSTRLRDALGDEGMETPVFGTFNMATEATVVRIDGRSIEQAAVSLMAGADVDALFLSCTNLRTLDVIEGLEAKLGVPVLSSNQVLAWHMMQATGLSPAQDAPGILMRNQIANRAATAL